MALGGVSLGGTITNNPAKITLPNITDNSDPDLAKKIIYLEKMKNALSKSRPKNFPLAGLDYNKGEVSGRVAILGGVSLRRAMLPCSQVSGNRTRTERATPDRTRSMPTAVLTPCCRLALSSQLWVCWSTRPYRCLLCLPDSSVTH